MSSSQVEAGGNIYPSRFVILSAEYVVTQAEANGKVFGISQVGTNEPPTPTESSGYAAISGQILTVHQDHEEPLLELGGTVSAGDELKSDANGKGVVLAGSGSENIGAIALQSGVSGNKIKVRMHRGTRYT